MDTNMLVNLCTIMIKIRFTIKADSNAYVIEQMINCINIEADNSTLINLLTGKVSYMDDLILENGKIVHDDNNTSEFLVMILNMAKSSIEKQEYDFAYDCIDLVHFLPKLIINYNRSNLKDYRKVKIKNFSKKWGVDIYKNSKKYFH